MRRAALDLRAELERAHNGPIPPVELHRLAVAEVGAAELRRRKLAARRDVTAKLYRDALGAYAARLRDGSVQRYQLQTLLQSFTAWRAAVGALADFESSARRLPAVAAE